MNDSLLKALHYLLLISEVEEVEIFKICLAIKISKMRDV